MSYATEHTEPDIDLFGRQRYRPQPDPSLALESPVLCRLLEYWRGKAAVRPPGRADIDPLEIGADLPHVVLLDIEHDPLRFKWRLLGAAIVDATGRNRTGQRFEEIYPHPVLADTMRVFSRVALTGLPIRHLGTARLVGKDHLNYESLHLPLFGEDDQVRMMLGGLHFRRITGPARAVPTPQPETGGA